jgi:hypothetical protein
MEPVLLPFRRRLRRRLVKCTPAHSERKNCKNLVGPESSPTPYSFANTLVVVAQQVVPIETGTADGRSGVQTSMRAVPIV